MREMSSVLQKRMGGSAVGAIDVDARTATFVFSSGAADRMGDIIDQSSWQLDRYKQNPQFLWAHRSREMPIGQTIDLAIRGDKLIGTVRFAKAEEYPFAETCWNMVRGGFLRAVSVGFIPHTYESYSDDTTGARGYKLSNCELLECSLVPIPCNQDALLGTKDAATLMPAVRGLLDAYGDDDAGVYSRDELEAVVKALGTDRAPNLKFDSDIDGLVVYDDAGEMMGLMVNGSLKMTRAYQDKLRTRNAALIDQQATATTTEATTEKKTAVVGPNFFLKREKARALARRTLLGA